MNARIWDFPGGIHPPENKEHSTRTPIQQPPLPAQLILPLMQHIGNPAVPCVEVGQKVLKGQVIALPDSPISAALHAPTSGVITAIGDQPYPHVSGMWAPAIVLDSDGRDEWIAAEPCGDYRQQEPQVLLERIRHAGISGLGGAGFPTTAKLSIYPSGTIHTLVVNAAECEPYITADDMLMREQSHRLVGGIDVLTYILKPKEVVIGIENNKPQAIAALRQALGERDYRLQVIPTKYPSGGEKQLIQILTGQEVPNRGLPADIGIICQNTGTLAAIYDAVVHCRPLISRIVTLTGNALRNPMNVEALIGTPIRELLTFAALQEDRLERLIMGGPLMGNTLLDLNAPLIKTTNCLLAVTADELSPPHPTLPCIRCGNCAQVCPIQLLPQQLHFFAMGEQHEQLQALNLFDCIECGCCAYVCPSHIPLVQYYRAAKADIRDLRQKQLKSERAKHRFEQRQQRLDEENRRKAEARQARQVKSALVRAATDDGLIQTEATQTVVDRVKSQKSAADEQYKRLKIEASLAKAALKKAEREQQENDSDALRERIEQLRQAAEHAEQALLAHESQSPKAQPGPAVETDAELKKAKIELSMAKAQLKKSEKAFGDSPTPEQQATLDELRQRLKQQQERVDQLEATTSKPASSSASAEPSPEQAELKRAKIEVSMTKAQIKKSEKAFGDSPTPEQQATLDTLRQTLQQQQERVDQLEFTQQHASSSASAEPFPEQAELKRAKIEVSMTKAQIKKLEKAFGDSPTPEQQVTLDTLRQTLQQQQERVDQLEATTSKPASSSASAEPSPEQAELKRAKIEVSMTKAQLKRSEKAFGDSPTPEQQATLDTLRATLTRQQSRLPELESPPSSSAPVAGSEATDLTADTLKRIKIETAMARSKWKRAEKLYGDSPSAEQIEELKNLRTAYERQQAQLVQLEGAFSLPDEPIEATLPAMDALKEAKIALANKRAALKQARQTEADEATLALLQEQCAQAEQTLHQAELQCGQPVPERRLIDKKPIDEQTRRLKTDLALARAQLHKLQRTESVAPEVLETARLRVVAAEQALTAKPAEE